jgi:hypothetical protein
VERSGAGRHPNHEEETMERARNESRPVGRPMSLGDYFVVSTEWDNWCVSTEMARHIDACLDADPAPPWIAFVDVTGARVRVRADRVESLTQRSIEQRGVSRVFERLARQERQADGVHGDDD